MSKSYYDIAHSFFYADESLHRGNDSYSSRMWYSKPFKWENDKGRILMQAYSYSTVIGEIRLDKYGRKVFVMSENKYSNTTAKHLSYLRNSCPFDILHVPYVDGGALHAFESRFEGYLKDFDENSFRKKENRNEFLRLLSMLDKYEECIGTNKKLRGIRSRKTIKYYEELCHAIDADRKNVAQMSDAARKRYERKQAKVKAERERVKKFVDKFMKSKNRNAMLQAAFRYDYYMDEKTKALHDTLTKGNNYSFVWVDDDVHKVCTSRRVTVSEEEVARLLRLWKARENILGQKVSCYTIVENNQDHVKVGCHIIPLWNVEMLYQQLIAA